MSYVKLSRKSAQMLVDFFATPRAEVSGFAVDELRRAAVKQTRTTKIRSSTPTSKKAAQKTRARFETSAIYGMVMARAAGICECGCGTMATHLMPLEMDHFWGRGKRPQSVENCWALIRQHHRQKTDNKPTAKEWTEKFRSHALKRGYLNEAREAYRRILWLAAAKGA